MKDETDKKLNSRLLLLSEYPNHIKCLCFNHNLLSAIMRRGTEAQEPDGFNYHQ